MHPHLPITFNSDNFLERNIHNIKLSFESIQLMVQFIYFFKRNDFSIQFKSAGI